MFALLFHEGMDPFYENVTSFPTVIFTIVLGVSLLFWLIAILGLVDMDFLDVDADVGDVGDADIGVEGLGGILMKFGLNGVPLTIVISIMALIGWVISYVAVALINPLVPGRVLEFVVGIPIFLATIYFSAIITAVLIKPLRTLFKKMEAPSIKNVLGRIAVVRSSRVDNGFGEAIVEDGGAGLLLRVRTRGEEKFAKGDKVVLLEHDETTGIYYVISETEFNS